MTRLLLYWTGSNELLGWAEIEYYVWNLEFRPSSSGHPLKLGGGALSIWDDMSFFPIICLTKLLCISDTSRHDTQLDKNLLDFEIWVSTLTSWLRSILEIEQQFVDIYYYFTRHFIEMVISKLYFLILSLQK